MAIIEIDGVGRVEVGDEFKTMPPEQQQAFVAHIADQAGKGIKSTLPAAAPPAAPLVDKYQQAALDERAKLNKMGIDTSGGYSRRMLQGVTLGAADEILAGLQTPLSMIQHGTFNPVEGYNYAKARENLYNEDTRKQTGLLGDVAELAGGVGIGSGIAKAGGTLVKAGQGILPRMGAMAGEGLAYGGAQGLLDGGDSVSDRLGGAAKGAAIGGLLGGAIPAVGAGLSVAASPITSNIRARINPEAFAQTKFAETLANSGKSANEIGQALTDAAAHGQNEFTVADALGNAGQRALSNVTRSPGPARQPTVDFLTSRQMDQGRRVAQHLTDASGSTLSAEQTRTLLALDRSEQAAKNYGPVAVDQAAIDVSPAVATANKSISPLADNIANASGAVPTDLAARAGIEAGESSIRDPIRQAVKEARSYLASDSLTVINVDKAFRAKTNIDAMIAKATENGQGAMVEALKPVRDALDAQLARTSPKYAAARDAYSKSSGMIDAIDVGKGLAAPRNRTQDVLSTFGALPAEQQATARIGFFDPLITQAERRAGTMSDSARPLLSHAMREQLPALAAPGKGGILSDRIGREATMSETTKAALGGSKTADNLADAADFKIDPTILANLLHGRFITAGANAARGLGNVATGNTADVRSAMAGLLVSKADNKAINGILGQVTATAGKRAQASAVRQRGLLQGLDYEANQRLNR